MYNQIPYMMPASNAVPSISANTSLFGRINWSSLLSNAQKTLNVVNQAVPLYYQVKPVFKNIRAMSKIGKEFSKIGVSNKNMESMPNNNTNDTNQQTISNNSNSYQEQIPTPKFFL